MRIINDSRFTTKENKTFNNTTAKWCQEKGWLNKVVRLSTLSLSVKLGVRRHSPQNLICHNFILGDHLMKNEAKEDEGQL